MKARTKRGGGELRVRFLSRQCQSCIEANLFQKKKRKESVDLGRAAPLCVPGSEKRVAAADAVDTLSSTHFRTASGIIVPASRYQCSSRFARTSRKKEKKAHFLS